MSRHARSAAFPRLVPTPRADPPYDDEVIVLPGRGPLGPPATYGALALAPEPAVGPLLLDPPGTPHCPDPTPCLDPTHCSGPLAEPDARGLRALGQAVAEVLAGLRPATVVADRFTDRAHAELVRAGRMLHADRPPRTGLPHVHRPQDGVIEMCVLVHCGRRDHVLALRLERRGVQWLCTEFETA